MKNLFNFFFLFIIVFNLQGQKGPGGVGNNNGASILRFWYDASTESYANGDLVGAVSDLSGYGNNLTAATTERPVFTATTAAINNFSSFFFNLDDELETTYQGNTNENMSFFIVINPTSDRGLNIALQHGGRNTIGFSPSNNYTDFVGGSNHTSTSTNSGSWVIHSKTFANSGTNRLKFFVNNNNTDNFTHTIQNRTSNTWIGGHGTGGGTGLKGSIAEVFKFTKTITTAERIITENYLSAKYNIALTTNDFYDEDTSGEDYDFNVAGIGQASDGSSHTDSQGTGIIRINTPSTLSNDDFLFWGEDELAADYEFSSSLATGYVERIDTQWRVSKRNDLGTVSVSVSASDIDISSKQSCAPLQLAVSSSATFATKTTYNFVLSGGVYTATGVSFSDNDYFTLEYVDTIVLDDTTAYNGAGASNVPNTSDDCFKLLVKSSADGTPSLTENADVREVEVETGGKLMLDTNIRLQVTNNIQLDGEIRLVGSSQLIQTHSGASQISGSGNLFIDQDSDLVSVYRYNFWSSPVNNGAGYSVETVMKDGSVPTSAVSLAPNLNFTTDFDGSTAPLTLSSYWIYGFLNGDSREDWSQKFETGTFNTGEGYILKSPGAAQNYTFKGIPNDGDYSFVIDADKTSLLGNPYPSAIDANQLFIDSSNLATLYFWQHTNEQTTGVNNEGHFLSNYIGGYSYRNATMGTAADTNISGTAGLGTETYNAPGRYIPVGQGFFVETASGVSATVNFNNGQRFFETESGDSFFFKTNRKKRKVIEYPILKFGFEAKNLEGNYIHSQVGISFSEGRTFGLETGFDSRKSQIKDSDIYFEFEENTSKLVIAGVQEISEELLVPITLKIGTTDTVFLMLDEKQNIDQPVFIYDSFEDVYYDLALPIALNLEQNTYFNRFYITFNNITLSKKEELFNDKFNVYTDVSNQKIIIETFNNNVLVSKISLYDLTGKEILNVKEKKGLNDTNKIVMNTGKLAASIYFVKISTNKGVVSKKIVLE